MERELLSLMLVSKEALVEFQTIVVDMNLNRVGLQYLFMNPIVL